jgi:hypothetical protein
MQEVQGWCQGNKWFSVFYSNQDGNAPLFRERLLTAYLYAYPGMGIGDILELLRTKKGKNENRTGSEFRNRCNFYSQLFIIMST